MIIGPERDVTTAVLAAAARAPDARFRELLTAAVTYLNSFVRETRLTEAEFQQLCGAIARAGQMTNASHNEVVLASGSLDVSALVCLLNNGQGGQTETTANLMGPFWRLDAPRRASGDSILEGPTPRTPRAPDVVGPWCTLAHRFVIEPGESRLPRPPITGKAEGPRPAMVVLQRTAKPEV